MIKLLCIQVPLMPTPSIAAPLSGSAPSRILLREKPAVAIVAHAAGAAPVVGDLAVVRHKVQSTFCSASGW